MRTATIYNFLIEANIIAGIAILLMIPVRKFFRKSLGNRAICFAWLLVAIRLLCPLSLPNPLINEIVTPYNDQPEAVRPIAAQFRVRISDALSDATVGTALNLVERKGITFMEAIQSPEYQAAYRLSGDMDNGRLAKRVMLGYGLGMLAVAGWFAVVNIRFQRNLKRNRVCPLEGCLKQYYDDLCGKYGVKPLPVYFVDPLSSACLVGGFRPFIALPLAASESQAKQMLSHELCHYKAKDNLWTLLTLLCCVIHWFNPLVWAAAAMSRMDRELKCDDNVTKDMDEEARRLYAGTLIQSVTRRSLPGMPVLATGMSMTGRKMKARVGGILWGGKRVKTFAIGFAVTASLLLICAFGTAAYGEGASLWENDGEETVIPFYYEPSSQTMEEALAAENAIPTKEEALKIAKAILGGEEMGVDVENKKWTWTVDDTLYGVRGKLNYWVVGTWNHVSLSVALAVDGSGAWLVTNGSDPYYTEDYMAKYEYVKESPFSQEELDRIQQFCMDFAEKVEPGETQYFKDVVFNGFLTVDGVTYVQLEAWYELSHSSSKTFIVKVTPELVMVDYYSGNG